VVIWVDGVLSILGSPDSVEGDLVSNDVSSVFGFSRLFFPGILSLEDKCIYQRRIEGKYHLNVMNQMKLESKKILNCKNWAISIVVEHEKQ
jgi:hypothetical protein